MGPRRSLRAVAARTAAIGLLALCSAVTSAAHRSRDDATASPGEVRLGRKEGAVSPREQGRSGPMQAGLFAEQVFLENQDQELLRQQNALWARDAPLEAKQEDGLVVPPSAGAVAAATRDGAATPSKEVVEAGDEVDLQEDRERQAGGGDGIAAAVAGIATGVLAALAAATGGAVVSAAPETLSDGSETALFAPDHAVGEELQASGGGAGSARRLRGASPAASGGSSSAAGRGLGVGGDATRGGEEAGANSAGDVHRVLQEGETPAPAVVTVPSTVAPVPAATTIPVEPPAADEGVTTPAPVVDPGSLTVAPVPESEPTPIPAEPPVADPGAARPHSPSLRAKPRARSGCLIFKVCGGMCKAWTHGTSMFAWADKGQWISKNDESVDLDSRKFRIGFEPLFVDYTQKGSMYVTFLLFEWFSFGLIAGFVTNGTIQTAAIFLIYMVDFFILVCFRPFSNSIIQCFTTMTVFADALTLGIMCYATFLEPDDDDDHETLELAYAGALLVQTAAIFLIYMVDFFILVCFRPFSNSIIQCFTTMTVFADALTLGIMCYATFLEPDDDDDHETLELAYAGALLVQTLAILFFVIPLYLDAFVTIIGTLCKKCVGLVKGSNTTKAKAPIKGTWGETASIFCALVRENFVGCVKSTWRGPSYKPATSREIQRRWSSRTPMAAISEDSSSEVESSNPGFGRIPSGSRPRPSKGPARHPKVSSTGNALQDYSGHGPEEGFADAPSRSTGSSRGNYSGRSSAEPLARSRGSTRSNYSGRSDAPSGYSRASNNRR
eukprot:g12971.t2